MIKRWIMRWLGLTETHSDVHYNRRAIDSLRTWVTKKELERVKKEFPIGTKARWITYMSAMCGPQGDWDGWDNGVVIGHKLNTEYISATVVLVTDEGLEVERSVTNLEKRK